MGNTWFRFYHEWDSDPKVQSMSEPMQRRLVMLFCSRCREETLHETDRAFHWRISPEELAETKALFLEKGFIDENWNLLNWNRRQFLSDSSTERVRRHRLAMKQPETLHSVTVKQPVTGGSVSVSVSESVTVPEKPLGFVLPKWIDSDAWAGFEEMRKKIRAPLTDRARAGIVKELQKICALGDNGAAILDQSTRNSWRGVFPLKENGNGSHFRAAEQSKPRNPPKIRIKTQAEYDAEDREQYETWLTMNDAYRAANPWSGDVPGSHLRTYEHSPKSEGLPR